MTQCLFIWKTFSVCNPIPVLYEKGSGIAMVQTLQCTENTLFEAQNDFAETSTLFSTSG